MRFYRVSYHTEGGNSAGHDFFTNKREARAAAREWDEWQDCDEDKAEIEVVEVEPTKRGILRALNNYAGHPDNG